MRVQRNHHRETEKKLVLADHFVGSQGKSATSVWSHVGQSHSLKRPRILTPPSWLDPLGDAEGEAEAVPSSSSSSCASKKHTETGFAIITWNNPKNWRNPVSPRDLLPVIFYGWFSHVTRSLWWTPWKYRKIRISWCRNQSWMMRLKWLLWTCISFWKMMRFPLKHVTLLGTNISHGWKRKSIFLGGYFFLEWTSARFL